MDSAEFREAARTAIDESKSSMTEPMHPYVNHLQSLIITTMSPRSVSYPM